MNFDFFLEIFFTLKIVDFDFTFSVKFWKILSHEEILLLLKLEIKEKDYLLLFSNCFNTFSSSNTKLSLHEKTLSDF